MSSYRTMNNLAGWVVFAIAAIVYYFSAEPTGSLWDCGEFIAGAYKLQVVHPPGAPIFLLIGRLFTWVAGLISSAPEAIAFSVNLLSGLCTAAGAMMVAWTTGILGKLALVGREEEPTFGQNIAISGAALVGGLTTAFCTSIWFSAVEGEVYAMSFMFTCLVFWAMVKWYGLPDTADADRWIIFALYAAGLSIGVHLLSLLTFPALALFYYYKKSKAPTFFGALMSAAVGTLAIVLIQVIIIGGIPSLWAGFEKTMVNDLGLPFNSGLIPMVAVVGGLIWFGLRTAQKTGNGLLQKIMVALAVIVVSYTCYGMVLVRAQANPPINMNDPSDPMRMLPYLNREQYGDRPLLSGPHFDAKPSKTVQTDRWNRVGKKYEVTDSKIDYEYRGSDKMFFPRMQDYSQGRPAQYRQWADMPAKGPISFADNFKFFMRYQIGWMYWRYFMWNFSGRQNGDQGYFSWDLTSGHWLTGIDAFDSAKLGNRAELTDTMRGNQANNKYYAIPFLLGLLGMFWQFGRKRGDFLSVFGLFLLMGLGIIIYTNEPPSEPRERDYVLVGSFFAFSIWVGLSVLAIYSWLAERAGTVGAVAAVAIGLTAPVLMGTQNFDDHSRANHTGARDYASNFLNSCAPNAIIFTYGDNDTYPLWYAQEVENIRRDVRVVNLSLIAVDWYIEQLRRKVNDSAPIKLSLPTDKIRGFKRLQIPFYNPAGEDAPDQPMDIKSVIRFISEDHKLPTSSGRDFDTYLPTRKIYIPIDRETAIKNGLATAQDTAIAPAVAFDLGKNTSYILKDDLAVMDIIASNWPERPIYFAVTVQPDKLLGMNDYLQLEGLALRLVPFRNASDRRFSVLGSGRVASDIAFENIMTKFKWGGFDKYRMNVDRSYQPSVQTMRVLFIRTASDYLRRGEKAKAVALADKFFEAFPLMNFPWDFNHTFLVSIYVEAGEKVKAAEKIRSYANEMEQNLRYYKSLGDDVKYGYETDQNYAKRTVQDLMRMATQMEDTMLLADLEKQFDAYGVKSMPPDMQQLLKQ